MSVRVHEQREISWLRVARLSKGMTRRQLAEAAGVGSSTIVRLERLTVTPTSNTQLCLAAALGYDIDELWPAAGQEPSEQLLRFIEQAPATEILAAKDTPFTWLRIARLSRGMTRAQLAQAAGLSASAVHHLEWAHKKPRRTSQICLAMALGYRVEDLWPPEDEQPSQQLRDFARDLARERVLGVQA